LNYNNIYLKLIEKCKERGSDKSKLEGYYESHHILPKSLGGNDSVENLVLLTAREHFIAHILLWKANPDNTKLMKAAFLMSNRRKGAGGKIEIQTRISSRVYEALRKDYAAYSSKISSGENNPFYGKTHTQETKDKILKTKIERGILLPPNERPIKVLKGVAKGERHGMWGKSQTPETLEQVRQSWKAKDLRPWENPTAVNDLDKWALCDYFYDIWVATGSKGLKVFTKRYNKIHGTDHGLAYFTNPRLKFSQGWIPLEDTKWTEFRFNHLDMNGGWV
jgi:hypothetical protein